MGRISNSIDLAKASLAVLRSDKELAAIPLVSTAVCGVAAVVVGGGAFLSMQHVVNPAPGQNAYNATPLTWAVGIVGLFLIGMIAQFFAAVLIAGANERLEGGNPTIGSAISKASTRTGSILGWSIVNSTVGMILNAIREKAGFLGVAVTSLIGAAWNVITWLALPIIIVEGVGPITAIKRSVLLLKQTWGENLIAQIGFGAIGSLLLIPGVLVFGALIFVIPWVAIPLLFLYIAVVGSVMGALSAIYRTALYRFAVGLPNGEAFSEDVLAGAFRTKGGVVNRLMR
jgi:hypothetical protein